MPAQSICKCKIWTITVYFHLQHLFLNTLSTCMVFLPKKENISFMKKSSLYVFLPHKSKKDQIQSAVLKEI